MNNEIKNLLVQIHVAQKSFDSAIELADYESAHIISERLQLLTRQVILCQKQAIDEAK